MSTQIASIRTLHPQKARTTPHRRSQPHMWSEPASESCADSSHTRIQPGGHPPVAQVVSQSCQDSRSTPQQHRRHARLFICERTHDTSSGSHSRAHSPNRLESRASALHTLAFNPGGHPPAIQAASQSRQESRSTAQQHRQWLFIALAQPSFYGPRVNANAFGIRNRCTATRNTGCRDANATRPAPDIRHTCASRQRMR